MLFKAVFHTFIKDVSKVIVRGTVLYFRIYGTCFKTRWNSLIFLLTYFKTEVGPETLCTATAELQRLPGLMKMFYNACFTSTKFGKPTLLGRGEKWEEENLLLKLNFFQSVNSLQWSQELSLMQQPRWKLTRWHKSVQILNHCAKQQAMPGYVNCFSCLFWQHIWSILHAVKVGHRSTNT